MADTVHTRRLKKGLSERTKRRRYKARARSPFNGEVPNGPKIKHWRYIKETSDKLVNKDAKGAEKTLLKLLKKDPKNEYALSKLISMYTSWSKLTHDEPDRLEDAEQLCEMAMKWGIDSSAVATTVIGLYGAVGKFDKAWAVFENVVDSGFAGATTYNSMMAVCADKDIVKYAGMVFEMAKKNNVIHLSLYMNIITLYYKHGKYTEAEEIIKNAPLAIKNSPRILLDCFEFQRKLKKYEKTIADIDEFLSSYKDEKFDNKDYVHARTIRAYCMMHSGRKEEAAEDFTLLKENVDRTNIHYPRIICGFSFCKPVLTEAEREDLLADLDFFGLATGRSMRDKITNAVKLIEEQEDNAG